MMKFALILSLILIPSSAFAGHYNNGYYQQQIIKQKVVEFDADYYLGLKGYVIAKNQAIENSTKSEELRDEALLEALKALNKALDQRGIIPQNPQDPQDIPEVPAQPDNSTELDKKALSIFYKNCKNCHENEQKSGGISLFTSFKKNEEEFASLTVLDDDCKELVRRVKIHDSVNGVNLESHGKKRMPMGKDPLNNDDVETLRQWMLEKASSINKGE